MNILYLGVDYGSSSQRANALERSGHKLFRISPEKFVYTGRLLTKLHWETGGLLASEYVRKEVLAAIPNIKFDCVLVDGGRFVGPRLIKNLREKYGPIGVYNHDDPFGWRDRFFWSLLRRSISEYDLVTVVRTPNVAEAYAMGAKKVLYVYRCADEVAHAPRSLNNDDQQKYGSEVLFLGTWMEERGAFLLALKNLGVPLSIRGDRWDKCPEWLHLKECWRGPAFNDPDGEGYSKTIQCAKISLGLLSKGNRDLHTTRSMEIPYMGGLFCAERTSEHMELYDDGEEAVFWSNAKECADVCKQLLADEDRRLKISARGKERALRNNYTNEGLAQRILNALVTG